MTPQLIEFAERLTSLPVGEETSGEKEGIPYITVEIENRPLTISEIETLDPERLKSIRFSGRRRILYYPGIEKYLLL
jgi:hypothetical protein